MILYNAGIPGGEGNSWEASHRELSITNFSINKYDLKRSSWAFRLLGIRYVIII